MEIFQEFSRLLAEALSPTIKEIIIEEVPKLISPPEPKYYSVRQICMKCGICETTFYNWVKRGNIKTLKEGRFVKVRAEDVDEAIALGDLGRYKHTNYKGLNNC